MTTSNNTTSTPVEKDQETSLDLRDATNWAENIVHTAINMRAADRLSGAALRLWEAGAPLFEAETGSPDHREAVKLSLDALIMQPEVLAWVAREARDHLATVETAETLHGPLSSDEAERIAEVMPQLLAWLDGAKATENPDESLPLTNIKPTRAELKIQNVVNWINDLLTATISGGLYEHLPQPARTLFSAGMRLSEGGSDDDYPFDRRAGYLIAVTALLQAPDAAMQTVANLRATLLEADPTLAPLAGDVTPLEPTPLAVNHTIDALTCELRPDGALDLESTSLGLVRLEPREAYALAMFMRSPAAVALLEAQNALRMTEGELSFQDDQAEEAVRMAGGR